MQITGSIRQGFAGLALMLLGASAAVADNTPSGATLLERGQYLAIAADCAACHSVSADKMMAGGVPIESPFGMIYSSNISPSKQFGIGDYSEAQFARAVREGVNAKGEHLYPAMPYPSYAGISDDDIHALYAWFMQGVKPVDAAPPATQLAFPFNQRWLMFGWNMLFANGKPLVNDESKSPEWNRGRYLVEALGHCDACHTPRNIAMGEESGQSLAGGQVGAWFAPNITSDPVSGIGGWSHAELMQYLRTGAVANKGQAAADMAEAIEKSLQYLTDADLSAIATYLKATPPIRNSKDLKADYSWAGDGKNYEPALRAINPGIEYHKDQPGYAQLSSGAALYSANCASCHQTSGLGTPDQAWPSLVNNSATGASNASNLVAAILNGASITTQGNTRLMPAMGDELTDEQIADIATFVMRAYGNPDVTISADQVATLRAGGANPVNTLYGMMAGAVVVLLLMIGGGIYLRRRKLR